MSADRNDWTHPDFEWPLPPVTQLKAALAGYDAQYGVRGIGEQHPDLPSGCVQRVEALVKDARMVVESDDSDAAAWMEAALRAIVGPEDRGPFIAAYRAAGGGYEGLQAIARLGLGEGIANA